MGQFRFSMYAYWQLGLMVKVTREEIIIMVPGINMHIATTKHAGGIFIFGVFIK
jgi:hypothetical protein